MELAVDLIAGGGHVRDASIAGPARDALDACLAHQEVDSFVTDGEPVSERQLGVYTPVAVDAARVAVHPADDLSEEVVADRTCGRCPASPRVIARLRHPEHTPWSTMSRCEQSGGAELGLGIQPTPPLRARGPNRNRADATDAGPAPGVFPSQAVRSPSAFPGILTGTDQAMQLPVASGGLGDDAHPLTTTYRRRTAPSVVCSSAGRSTGRSTEPRCTERSPDPPRARVNPRVSARNWPSGETTSGVPGSDSVLSPKQ